MDIISFAGKERVSARSLLVGERIDLRSMKGQPGIAAPHMPIITSAGEHGSAVLFRYGVVVFFNVSAVEEESFLRYLRDFIQEPYEYPESEDAVLGFSDQTSERVDKEGTIWLNEPQAERLQIVADILAKSVVLSFYEASTAKVFDRIEPLAAELNRRGKAAQGVKELLRQIGSTLLVQHKTVGRVAVEEKPELLWDYPELERLYLRLEDEYEIRERHLALDRKLEVVSRTAETLLDLLHHKRSLRVEWYIVILILVEILLTLYQMSVMI